MIIKHAPRKPGTRDRLLGLLEYLAGPGRFEEHTNQRIVAAWDESLVASDLQDPAMRADLADEMEVPARLRGMETPKDGWVYHVPVSLSPDDPELSDAQWGYVARKVVDKLGFGGEGGCRWVAVHHGLARTEDGRWRDHIHLVVHRAREDGTVASVWRDRLKMREVRAELEDDPTLGLIAKTQRGGGGRDGWHRGEKARAEREGRSVTAREELERRVRAAIGPAESETEWVLAMREGGVLVRPRFGAGSSTTVVGYSVALPVDGEPIWYAGGKLARDLTVTAVRRRWDGHDPAAAVAAWSRKAGQRQQAERTAAAWDEAGSALREFEATLLATPLDDQRAWRAAARETAEAVAALSARASRSDRAVLRRTAVRLARAAELPSGQGRGAPSRGAAAMRAACRVITSAAIAEHGGMLAVAQLTIQLSRVAGAVSAAHDAVEAAAATRHAALAQRELLDLHARLRAPTSEAGSDAARVGLESTPMELGQRTRRPEATRPPITPSRVPRQGRQDRGR